MRSLITGITGMSGSHLAELLLTKNDDVFGVVREQSKLQNIEHLLNDVELVKTDLLSSESVSDCIKRVRPDVIYHLAAQTQVPASWNISSETMTINVVPQIHIFEAVKTHQLDTVIHIASSSEVYGKVSEDENPLNETTITRPANPYAVSKLMQEYIANQYFTRFNMKTIVTRTFNHTGPRRREQFVESNLAKQFAEMELGLRKPVVHIGNLSASRDFTDVRDIVRAYHDIVRSNANGETFNICSGQPIQVAEILTTLCDITGLTPEVVQDASRLRSGDQPIVYGSYDKLHRATGWRPAYTFKETLRALLEHWRDRLAQRSAERTYTY